MKFIITRRSNNLEKYKDNNNIIYKDNYGNLTDFYNEKIFDNVFWNNKNNKLELDDFTHGYDAIYEHNFNELHQLFSLKKLAVTNKFKVIIPYWCKNNDKVLHLLYMKHFFILKEKIPFYEQYVDYINCCDNDQQQENKAIDYFLGGKTSVDEVFNHNYTEGINGFNDYLKYNKVRIDEERANCGGRCEHCTKCDTVFNHYNDFIKLLQKQ